jgi:hypothetical protein
MRSAILSLTALIGSTVAVDIPSNSRFVNWIGEHSRNYQSIEEFQHRQALWMERDQFINNFYETNHSELFNVGHNKFSDWTKEEFKSVLGLKKGLGDQTIVPKDTTNL